MTLSLKQHNAIVLYLSKGMSYRVIANLVRVSRGAVADRRGRSRQHSSDPVTATEIVHCTIHKTITPGFCVMCRALAEGKKQAALTDGPVELCLLEDDAKRLAELLSRKHKIRGET